MKRFFVLLALVFLIAIVTGAESSISYTIKEGLIGSCSIKIAVPAKWNGSLLIFAHGLRSENQPLSADFNDKDKFSGRLLSQGWMVASTSYRRNGWIVDDAIQDIADLRVYIESTYGKPKHIYICGASMGGMIVTKIAEMEKAGYDGVLAIGAALVLDAPDPKEKINFNPRIPVIFLTNRSEVDGPKDYAKKSVGASVIPVLWHVERDGHCNVTAEESYAAFKALVKYRDTGKIIRSKDGTIVPPPPPSRAVFKDGKAFARMTGANIDTEFVAADLKQLGIEKGSYLIVRFGEKNAKVLFGTTYGDVPVGEWICFVKAEGFLRIARNYDNAIAFLGCKAGDTISIEPENSTQDSSSREDGER